MRSPTDPLTIIMYHYVGDPQRRRYPRIKGLLTDHFIGQLDYVQKYYSLVSMEDVISAYAEGQELPARPCLLTFDDGFIDHYVTVFPLLKQRGLSAGFFPSAQPILERRLADVHRLQLILATVLDPNALAGKVLQLLAPYRKEHRIPNDEDLYQEFGVPDPFDTVEVTFVKRLLSTGQPRNIYGAIYGQLFREIVSEDEAAVAQELYMDISQLRCMARDGMHIGGHGYLHSRLTALSKDQQHEEIQGTVRLLSEVYGEVPRRWAMAYPWGDRDENTLDLLRETTCSLGLLSVQDLAPRDSAVRLELPRLDTNDLPTSGDAEPCHWTKTVLQGETQTH